MVPDVSFNNRPLAFASADEFERALQGFDSEPQFELWASVPDGPSICMLRNARHAWLMYLRFPGDSGFNTTGDASLTGMAHYTLGNGQVDEYPLSWCVEVSQCYKAMLHFVSTGGDKAQWLAWHES